MRGTTRAKPGAETWPKRLPLPKQHFAICVPHPEPVDLRLQQQQSHVYTQKNYLEVFPSDCNDRLPPGVAASLFGGSPVAGDRLVVVNCQLLILPLPWQREVGAALFEG